MEKISPLKALSLVVTAIGVVCGFVAGIMDKRVQDQAIREQVAKAISEVTNTVGG